MAAVASGLQAVVSELWSIPSAGVYGGGTAQRSPRAHPWFRANVVHPHALLAGIAKKKKREKEVEEEEEG